jgi:hypothetical protein
VVVGDDVRTVLGVGGNDGKDYHERGKKKSVFATQSHIMIVHHLLVYYSLVATESHLGYIHDTDATVSGESRMRERIRRIVIATSCDRKGTCHAVTSN